MRIGILTFHRAYNYGAVLQCYALQQYLSSLGHDVEVIDYRQKWIDACFTPFSWLMFKYNLHHPRLMLQYVKTFLKRKSILCKRKVFFDDFVSNFLKVSCKPVYAPQDIPNCYDAIIIGSDQLWGRWCLGNQLDKIYLGIFPRKKGTKLIGYSISSDADSIDMLNDNYQLIKVLSNFSAISFREKNIANYVQQITGKSCPITLDPTLLCDEDTWNPLINQDWSRKKYIVIYQVRGIEKYKELLYNKATIIANSFSDKCDIIDLSDMHYSVTDFISIIKYAKFVVTTSFHATVFSIIFKTPFYALILNDGRDNRYENLCEEMNLSDRCINVDIDKFDVNTDFSDMNERLSKISSDSKEFIIKNLLV